MREEMAGTLRLMDIAKKMLKNICRMSFGKKHSLIMTIERRNSSVLLAVLLARIFLQQEKIEGKMGRMGN